VIDTLRGFHRGGKGRDEKALYALKDLYQDYNISLLVVQNIPRVGARDPFAGISETPDGVLVLDRDAGRLFVTGRDVPEVTVPVTLAMEKTQYGDGLRWSLGEAKKGIHTAESRQAGVQCIEEWLEARLGIENA